MQRQMLNIDENAIINYFIKIYNRTSIIYKSNLYAPQIWLIDKLKIILRHHGNIKGSRLFKEDK